MVKSQGRSWLLWLSWLYLIFVIIQLLALQFLGDSFWPATMLLFGPRWMIGLPLIVIIPLGLRWVRFALIPSMVACVLIAWPLMGLNVPLPLHTKGKNSTGIRIITCNTQMGNAKVHLDELIRNTAPDMVVLQECPRELPIKVPQEWAVIRKGELALLSRFPLKELAQVKALHPPHKWPRFSALFAEVNFPGENFIFCAVHLPSPRYGLQHVLDRRTGINIFKTGLLQEETEERREVAKEVSNIARSYTVPLIIAGDFNMPVESSIYRESFGDFTDAFTATGLGYGYTEHDAIRGMSIAIRIDHVLTAKGAVPVSCRVGPDVGSDHRPLIADIVLRRD